MNHETEQSLVESRKSLVTDNGFSEKKSALKTENPFGTFTLGSKKFKKKKKKEVTLFSEK